MSALPRIWRFVSAAYVSRLGHGLVWRCELACGHQQWRPCKHQPCKPVRLVCEVCERERDLALRPAWMRGAA